MLDLDQISGKSLQETKQYLSECEEFFLVRPIDNIVLYSSLTEEQWILVYQFLKEHQTYTALSLMCGSHMTLNHSLLAALCYAPDLHTINLFNAQIGDQGIEYVCDVLCQGGKCNVKFLYLDNTGITNRSIPNLCRLLRKNTKLRILSVDGNPGLEEQEWAKYVVQVLFESPRYIELFPTRDTLLRYVLPEEYQVYDSKEIVDNWRYYQPFVKKLLFYLHDIRTHAPGCAGEKNPVDEWMHSSLFDIHLLPLVFSQIEYTW